MPRKGLKREQVQPEIEKQLADDGGVIISSGNDKLMKIPNLSLMPGKTCPGEVAECKYCTAKGVLRYSTWCQVRWTVTRSSKKEGGFLPLINQGISTANFL